MRVLVVGDERPLVERLRRGLTDEGFVVDVAHEGVSGLGLAEHGVYDVLVLDIMLPGLHGYEILKRLRAREVWTPVLMLTSNDGEFDQTEAFDLGADDYLAKPFSLPVLVARLRALVRRGAPARPVALRCGDLVLDPLTHSVRRGQTLVDVTPQEFLLLQLLMGRCGDAVSTSEILAAVWDSDYPGNEHLVEVYVGYLRRKIDVPFGVTSLQTVRGRGYRLAAAAGE
jgi:DNA-binding response OmpR family regulator